MFAFNKKIWYNDVTMYKDKRKQYQNNTRYEHNAIDKITFRLRKDGGYGVTREDIQKVALSCNMSVNEFVLQAVKEKIERTK